MPDLLAGRRPAGLVPPPGVLPRINRRHPLAQGLVGLWFPAGGNLVLDLTGNMQPLTAANTANGPGPNGYQARDTDVGPSFWSTMNIPAAQKPVANFSALYVGQYLGGGSTSQNPTLLGVLVTTGAPPYVCWGFNWAGTFTPHAPYASWSYNSTSSTDLTPLAAPVAGAAYSLVVAVPFGGTAGLWNRGTLAGVVEAPAGAIDYASPAFYLGGGGGTTTQNAGFGFSLGALWNRALSASQAQALSADPWQILEWPWDRLPRGLAANNLAVLLDRLAPAEYLTGVMEPGAIDPSPYLDTGDGSWLDTGDGSYLDTGVEEGGGWSPFEIGGNVAIAPRDIVFPLENGLTTRRDIEAAAESLATGYAVTGDAEAPIEAEATAAADREGAVESLGTLRSDPPAPVATATLWRLDAALPAASGGSVMLDRPAPAASAGSIGTDAETRTEWLGQPPLVVLSADCLEFLAAPHAEGMAVAWTINFRTATEAPAEASGTTARSTVDAALSIEALGTATREELPVEWLALIPRDRSVAAEWAALFAAKRFVIAEWAGLATSYSATIAEWLRGLAADPIANSEAPIEFGQTNPPPLFLVERGRLR